MNGVNLGLVPRWEIIFKKENKVFEMTTDWGGVVQKRGGLLKTNFNGRKCGVRWLCVKGEAVARSHPNMMMVRFDKKESSIWLGFLAQCFRCICVVPLVARFDRVVCFC